MTVLPMERKGIGIKVEEVSPARAGRLLSGNIDNRRLRSRVVSQYAAAMKRGEWVLNNDAVVVDRDGRLLNGQHRLEAILSSGVTVPLLVMENADDETWDTMDTGAKRSFADVLRRHGEVNVNALAAATRQLWAYRSGLPLGNIAGAQPTHGQLLRQLRADPGLRQFVPPATTVRKELGIPESAGATLLYLFTEIDADQAAEFYDQLTTGVGLIEGSPIVALRRQLSVGSRQGRGSRGVNVRKFAALMIIAWNYWLEGRQLTYIRWQQGGRAPQEFPQIGRPSDDGSS